VHEITPESAISSFHPKCWWLWFYSPDGKERIVRFCISSRNLTFDRSWDVSFSFDGNVTDKSNSENKSMIDMLNFLNSQSDNLIEEKYIRDLSKTIFENDLNFKSWKFHPIGINNYLNPLADSYFRPDSLLMMSPFVDDKNIKAIADKTSEKCWLFSRKNELQKIKLETFEHLTASYYVSDVVVNGELYDNMTDEIPNAEPDYLDLHAKLFIGRKGNMITWFLGSANLTAPAFSRNIECLIELKTDDHDYRPEAIIKELVSSNDENKLFVDFLPNKNFTVGEQDEMESTLRKLTYDITRSGLTGSVLTDVNTYKYNINFNATHLQIPKELKIYLRPWNMESVSDHGSMVKAGVVNDFNFEQQFKLSQISKYFVFTVVYKSEKLKEFLVKAEIEIDMDARSGKIFSEIINSKEKFLQYLRFLLSDSGIVDESELNQLGNIRSDGNAHSEAVWDSYSLPLYEELLKTASQHPQKLRSIDELITKLKTQEDTKDYISPELNELWDVFKQFVK
jgi:hypothetical protein